MPSTLRLLNVNQYFNGSYLFDEDVSLNIQENSATLLYGGSGSGKTSLLNILIALTQPTKGEVFWEEHKISSVKTANKVRANFMSVLFSNFSFVKELSIKENILLGATLCKIENKEEKLAEITETLLNFKKEDKNIDLGYLLQKGSIDDLSNGQKEIIALAATLLLQTKFFMADEMLRSFPEDTKTMILKRLLAYFTKHQVGFFYITHWEDAQYIIKEATLSYNIHKIEDKKLHLIEGTICD